MLAEEGKEPAMKKVRIADQSLIFTSMVKPHSSTLRNKWLDYSRKEEYIQLKQELELYLQRGGILEKFFKKEGETILYWALIAAEKSKVLNFIVTNIPRQLIVEVLEKKDLSLVKSFLLKEDGIEKYKELSDDYLKNRCEKLELLLEVAPDPIKKLLESSLNDLGLGKGIKSSIIQAVNNNSSLNNDFLSSNRSFP